MIDKYFKTRTYLLDLLSKYKTILNNDKYEYLESLINLGLPCINNSITDLERYTLSELSIYNLINKYNIYHYTKKILESKSISLECFWGFFDDKYGFLLSAETSLASSTRVIKIFDAVITDEILVNIYNSLNNDSIKGKEITILNKKINEINNALKHNSKHIFNSLDWDQDMLYNYWKNDKETDLKTYQKALKKISTYRPLSKNDLREIEIANSFYNLFKDAYGIDDSELKLDKTDYLFGNNHKYMNKVKVKTMPNIKLQVNNYYL